MTIRDDFKAAADKVRKALDDEGEVGGALRYALGEAERQLDIHFPTLVPDVEKAATEVAEVAKDVPVPGASEVATVASDVAAAASTFTADAPAPTEPSVTVTPDPAAASAEVPANVEKAAEEDVEGFVQHVESEIHDEIDKVLGRDDKPADPATPA